MAFYKTPQNDRKPTLTLGSAPSTPTPGGAGGPGAPSPAQTPSSGGFVNIQNYLAANPTAGAAMGQNAVADTSKALGDYVSKAQAAQESHDTTFDTSKAGLLNTQLAERANQPIEANPVVRASSGYNTGVGAMDSYLIGNSQGRNANNELQTKYSSILNTIGAPGYIKPAPSRINVPEDKPELEPNRPVYNPYRAPGLGGPGHISERPLRGR